MCNGNKNPPNITKQSFCNLLNIATKEAVFTCNIKYYQQVDGVTMGPLLGPTLANIFKCSFESEWLQDFPNDFKPVFYRYYIVGIFFVINLQLISIEKNLQWGLYQLHKLYIWNIWNCFNKTIIFFGVSVRALILSNFIMRLISWKVFSIKTATRVTWLRHVLKDF